MPPSAAAAPFSATLAPAASVSLVPSDVEGWKTADVCRWLGQERLEEFVNAFQTHKITGDALVDLPAVDLGAMGINLVACASYGPHGASLHFAAQLLQPRASLFPNRLHECGQTLRRDQLQVRVPVQGAALRVGSSSTVPAISVMMPSLLVASSSDDRLGSSYGEVKC